MKRLHDALSKRMKWRFEDMRPSDLSSCKHLNDLSVAEICSPVLSYEKSGWFMDSCLVRMLSGLVPVAVSCSFLEQTFAPGLHILTILFHFLALLE